MVVHIFGWEISYYKKSTLVPPLFSVLTFCYSDWFSLVINSYDLSSWSVLFTQYEGDFEENATYVRIMETMGIPIMRKRLTDPVIPERHYVIVTRAVSPFLIQYFTF